MLAVHLANSSQDGILLTHVFDPLPGAKLHSLQLIPNSLGVWDPMGEDDRSRRGRELVKRRLKDAGLPDRLSPHSFRVAAVTDLLTQDVPLDIGQPYCLL